MKTYQVEFKRTSWVTLTVEATDQEAAEEAAWLELQTGDYDCNDAEWELNDVEVDDIATDETRAYGPQGETA